MFPRQELAGDVTAGPTEEPLEVFFSGTCYRVVSLQDALVLLTVFLHFLAKLLMVGPVSLLARIRAVHHTAVPTAVLLATDGRLFVAVEAGVCGHRAVRRAVGNVRADTLAISEASRVSIGRRLIGHGVVNENSGHSRGRKCQDTKATTRGCRAAIRHRTRHIQGKLKVNLKRVKRELTGVNEASVTARRGPRGCPAWRPCPQRS